MAINPEDDPEYFREHVLDCMRECSCTDPEYNTIIRSFNSYYYMAGKFRYLQTIPEKMTELAERDPDRFGYMFNDSFKSYFDNIFTPASEIFFRNNDFFVQHEHAYKNPDDYLPSNLVTFRFTRCLSGSVFDGNPIVLDGQLYTTGLYHFLSMWGFEWSRNGETPDLESYTQPVGGVHTVHEIDMNPQAIKMLLALQSVNERDRTMGEKTLQLVPLEISDEGLVLLLGEDVFLPWDGDCLWLKTFATRYPHFSSHHL